MGLAMGLAACGPPAHVEHAPVAHPQGEDTRVEHASPAPLAISVSEGATARELGTEVVRVAAQAGLAPRSDFSAAELSPQYCLRSRTGIGFETVAPEDADRVLGFGCVLVLGGTDVSGGVPAEIAIAGRRIRATLACRPQLERVFVGREYVMVAWYEGELAIAGTPGVVVPLGSVALGSTVALVATLEADPLATEMLDAAERATSAGAIFVALLGACEDVPQD